MSADSTKLPLDHPLRRVVDVLRSCAKGASDSGGVIGCSDDALNSWANEIEQSVTIQSKRDTPPVITDADLHGDTAQLVTDFAQAVADKLLVAQEKYGYSNGWMANDWMDECRAKLREHLEKGDPRDVAAYCAFLWWHNEPTAKDIVQANDDGLTEYERADKEREIMDKISHVVQDWQGLNLNTPAAFDLILDLING